MFTAYNKTTTAILTVFLSLAFSVFVHAEENAITDDDLFYLGEIIVRAGQVSTADLAQDVTIITREQIEESNATSVMDVLESVPGISVHKTGQFGRADINIRGIGDRATKIGLMVDGRPEKMSIFGCGVTHTFPIDNVERIEIIKGAASAIYGSDALGGVINIVTAKAEKEFEGSFQSTVGSYESTTNNLQVGGIKGDYNYFFTLNHEYSEGYRENSQWKSMSYTAKVINQLTDRYSLTLFSKKVSADKNEPGPDIAPTPTAYEKYDRGAEDVTLTASWKTADLALKFYELHGHHRFDPTDGWHSKDRTYGITTQYSYYFSKTTVSTGIDFKRQEGWSETPAKDESRKELAYFVNASHHYRNRLVLTAGARIHDDEYYGNKIAPQAGIVWHAVPGQTRLSLSASKAFRSPTLKDYYWYPPSNTDLDPEIAKTIEFGLEQAILENLKLDVSVYKTDIENGFQLVAPPPKFMNLDDYEMKGFETGLIWFPSEAIDATLYYSHLDPDIRTEGLIGSKYDFKLRIEGGNVRTVLTGQHVSDYFAANNSATPIDDYMTWNVKFNYPTDSNMQVFLTLENIFNEEYSIYTSLPSGAGVYSMPGTTVTLGVRFNF